MNTTKKRLTLHYKHDGRIVHLHNSDMNIILRQNVKNIHQMGVMKYVKSFNNLLIILSLFIIQTRTHQGCKMNRFRLHMLSPPT